MKATAAFVGAALSLAFCGVAFAADETPENPPEFYLDMIAGAGEPLEFQIEAMFQIVPSPDVATDDDEPVARVEAVYLPGYPEGHGGDAIASSSTTGDHTAAVLEKQNNSYTNMLNINGTLLGYIDVSESNTVPNTGAGIWRGSDDTTDGSWGYFVGHNPGSFACVAAIEAGDPVMVWDSNGNSRLYKVLRIFEVPRTTYWEEVLPEITGYGESVIMQTCMGPSAYRIVIAG